MSEVRSLEGFVEVMSSLMALMRHEIDLIKERRIGEIGALQSRKGRMTKAYEDHQRAIQKNPALLDALSEDERSDLRALYKRFRETLSDNMVAIRATQQATDRVVKSIITAVKHKRGLPDVETKPGVGRHGRASAAYAATAGKSFAYDQAM